MQLGNVNVGTEKDNMGDKVGAENENRMEMLRRWSQLSFPSHNKYWAHLWFPLMPVLFPEFGSLAMKLGWPEGISGMISRLDVDLDDIEANEAAKEKAQQLVDGYLNLLINFGVVGALIMSVLYPLLLTEIDFADISVNAVGKDLVEVSFYIYYACVSICTAMSLHIILESVVFYKHIAFWMVNLSTKLKYMDKVNIVGLAIKTAVLLFAATLAIPFGALAIISPAAFFISAGGLLLSLFMNVFTFSAEVDAFMLLHTEAARVFSATLPKADKKGEK